MSRELVVHHRHSKCGGEGGGEGLHFLKKLGKNNPRLYPYVEITLKNKIFGQPTNS